MNLNLLITSLIFILIIFLSIIYILRKGRMVVKYSLVWLFAIFVLLLFMACPTVFNFVTNVLGFTVGSNMIFAGLIAMLMFINIALTVIISGQNDKIRLLIQEVSMIKEKVNDKR